MGIFILVSLLLIFSCNGQDIIPEWCLIKSGHTVGLPNGNFFSHKYELIGLPTNLRLHSFTNCIDDLGNMTGI